MPNRRNEVVTIPFPAGSFDPATAAVAEALRETAGLLTSLLVVTLQLSETGLGLTAAGAGTVVVQANDTLDLEDARVNQLRLSGYANSSGAGDIVRLKQGSTVLCTASIPTGGAARFVGGWTRVALGGGDLPYSLEVVGDGIRNQTLHRVTLHARTF